MIAIILVLLQLVTTTDDDPNVTELVPWVEPKFAPAIVTEVPAGPEVGERELMFGVTVKSTPLLARLATVTTTLPVAAPVGTNVPMLVAVQLVTGNCAPLSVMVLVPWVAPKFVPLIVTEVPTGPDVGERLVILGKMMTVKATPLLATPPTVTTTFPVVAPPGTVTEMPVALQLVGVAAVPLKVTVLVPCDAPKFVPLIATGVPTEPEFGFRPVMLGPLPPPPIGLKAARTTPQLSEAAMAEPAATEPAAIWI